MAECRQNLKSVLKILAFSSLPLCLAVQSYGQTPWILPGQGVEDTLVAQPTQPFSLPAGKPTPLFGPLADQPKPSVREIQELWRPSAVAITSFSGTRTRLALLPVGSTAKIDEQDLEFINPDGASVVISSQIGVDTPLDGSEVFSVPYDKLLARDIGQVFGIAIDGANPPNLYLTASSAYGLYIVGHDANDDRVPDRLIIGSNEARWMPGQWGHDGSPGSIWRVDGETSQVSKFAEISDNQTASLGNIAYDAKNNQFFVSDLESGLIHRLSDAGKILDSFDHGVIGRVNSDMLPIPDDPSLRVDISSPEFDAEDPETWGFAADERRVWGLAVHDGKLYYSVADGPSVWSVSIGFDGDFLTDAREEFRLEGSNARAEITDIDFAPDGAMLLATRGARSGDQDYKRLTKPRRAKALRLVRETPDDPTTAPFWHLPAEQVPLGVVADANRSTGGVALGPGYGPQGNWDYSRCGDTIWLTGDALGPLSRLSDGSVATDDLYVSGVQALETSMIVDWQNAQLPTFYYDLDVTNDLLATAGWPGDVVVPGCDGAGGGGSSTPTNGPTSCTKPGGCGDPPPPPKPACIATSEPIYQCDSSTGTYTANAIITSLIGAQDTMEFTDNSGALSGVPASLPLPNLLTLSLGSLAPGSSADLDICGFNKAAKETGQPFDCCKTTLTLTAPTTLCAVEN